MLTIKTEGLEELKARVAEIGQKHVPFAAARALTQVAENARMDTVREIRQKLHVPTEWTIQSMFKRPATKRDLTAMVYLKDGGGSRRYANDKFPAMGKAYVAAGQDKARVIGHLFSGGAREIKGFENRLIRSNLMPAGMVVVPGAGAPLDARGNIPRGFIVQMLAYFKGLRESKDWMTDTGRARFGKRQGKKVGVGGVAVEYFISRGSGNWFGRRSWKSGREQNLPPGIWMRAHTAYGTAVKPVIMFIKKPPRYKQYFDLEAIARTALNRDFDTQFKAGMDEAMRTAK